MNRTIEFFEGLTDRLDLNEREKQVLKDRLWGRTFDELATKLGTTRERVRQIEERTVRKLMSPRALGYCFMTEEHNKVNWLHRRLQELRKPVELKPEEAREMGLVTSMGELDLPPRVASAMRRAGIETVEQVLHADDAALLTIRGFGLVSLGLVRERVSQFCHSVLLSITSETLPAVSLEDSGAQPSVGWP